MLAVWVWVWVKARRPVLVAEAPAPRGRNWEAVLVESREARRKAFMVVRVEDSVAKGKGPASACTPLQLGRTPMILPLGLLIRTADRRHPPV